MSRVATLVSKLHEEGTVPLVYRTVLLFFVFLLVDRGVKLAGDLPAEAYEEPSLLMGLLDRLGAPWLAVLAAAVIVGARYGRLLARWDAFEVAGPLRALVVVLAGTLSWWLATLGYNHYFDQGYEVDRLLIVVLVPLLLWRPVFVYPFLLLAYAILWQLGLPSLSSGAFFPFTVQLLQVLAAFGAFLLVYSAGGSREPDGFFFLTCCLIASAYWVPGAAKLGMGWITFGHFDFMPPAAYAHGWLGSSKSTTVVAFAQAVSWLDWPMRLFVLVTEAGALVFLWRRWLSGLLLIAFTVFHAGTFAMYGYLFWTWTVLNLFVLVILWRDRHEGRIAIFRPAYFVLSLALIATASTWVGPARLAWFDTRLTSTVRFDVVGTSGRTYPLSSRFWAPYGDLFTMASFSYVVPDEPRLVFPYGITTDRAVADRLVEATTADAVFALEREMGRPRYNERRRDRLYGFVERYFTNWNARARPRFALEDIAPPPQFWSLPGEGAFSGEEKVRAVIVKEVTMLYDGETLDVIRELELARIPIPRGTPAP